MQRQQQNSRIDLADLKGQIVKRIGMEKSRRYFYYLTRLIAQKLCKNEFNKLCFRIIGKENLSLHNHFVRSILRNANDGKVPPAMLEAGPAMPMVDDGHKQSDYPNLAKNASWSNGVVSPKKGRSCIRDRRLKDRPGMHLSNGNVEHASHRSTGSKDNNGIVVKENGEFTPCDYQRPVQQVQGETAEPPIREREASIHQHQIREKHSLQRSKDGQEASLKDGLPRYSLHAPLGIPFYGACVGGSLKSVPASCASYRSNCYDDGSLPDTESLQKRMEEIAVAQGLGGVSMESAHILNNGLDMYLRQLITSCVSMMSERSGNGASKQISQKQQIQSKLLNGILPSDHLYGGPAEAMQEHRPPCPSASMLDFKVAMELNPQQIGEEWPLVMEKICMHQFAE